MRRAALITLGTVVAAVALWATIFSIIGWPSHARPDPVDAAVPAIMAAEGFRGQPYTDTRGNPTIGYGTKLPITLGEGELLLRHRLAGIVDCIKSGWGGWAGAGEAAQRALADAGYALGCPGLLGFHEALAAIERGDFAEAAQQFKTNEAGDGPSDWYEEEPARVDRVIATLRHAN